MITKYLRTLLLLSFVSLLLVACGRAAPAPPPAPAPTDIPAPAPTTVSPTDTTTPPQETTADEPETDIIAAGSSLAPAGVPGETYLAPFPVAISLDGDLSDWEGVPKVTMPETAVEVQGSTSVTFAAAADDQFLYFMADVTDPKIITGQHGTDYWNEDSVELYINATGNLQLTTYTDGVAQITVPPLNAGRPPEEVVVGGVQVDTTNAQVVVVNTDQGYAMEIAVPLQNDVWDIQREHGDVIGFQVHLNGAGTQDRNLKVIWSVFDTADNSYLNPSLFGQLIFFEIGQADVVANLPEPALEPTREQVAANAPYKNPELPVADRVEDLMARMTLDEKIGQMTLVEKNSINAADIATLGIGGLLSGGGGFPQPNTPQSWAEMVDGFQGQAMESRLGIPLIYGVDAVHGHNNVLGAVIFPHNIGLGAANDPALVTQIGRVTALEMIATGIYWDYAPVVAVPQDIRWGRTYEAYSENTDQVSLLATAFVNGLQGDDLSAPDTALATPKHFVGDGGAVWGSSTTGSYKIDQGVTDVDEATLRAIHLPPYQAAIDAGARSVMISYTSWGGMKMHGQQYLITDVLRGELGFDGFVVSDWAGIDQISSDYNAAVITAINAGVDMNMVPYNYRRFINAVLEAVENGDITEARIDEAVRNILTVKFELGLFEQPYSDPALLPLVGSDEHRAVAREAVAKSLVLLKNEGDILPLGKDLPLLLVGGEAADNIGIQSGGWTIEWQGKSGDITPGTSILQAVNASVSPETTVIYDEFGRFNDVAEDDWPFVCLAVVGELPYAEGIGDSAALRLPVKDLRVLERMTERCDQLVVVMVSGRPLIISDQIDDWDALVAAWLPGTEGQGVTDVLFGDVPFGGKLSYTWPRSVEQLPFDFTTLEAGEPLFPYGFGLTGRGDS
jgi:beta-glucosidase